MTDTNNKYKESCRCVSCKNACKYNPGWFLPEEVEKVAKFLNISLKELFDKYLGVNWWSDDGDTTFLLAPAISSMNPGEEYPGDPRGTCIFYKKEQCEIHDVRSFECREYWHGEKYDDSFSRHADVRDAWRHHQEMIVKLLGRQPETESFRMFNLFNIMQSL
jgi:Fe-S-cluster containining protein